jgi:hypothetical protein
MEATYFGWSCVEEYLSVVKNSVFCEFSLSKAKSKSMKDEHLEMCFDVEAVATMSATEMHREDFCTAGATICATACCGSPKQWGEGARGAQPEKTTTGRNVSGWQAEGPKGRNTRNAAPHMPVALRKRATLTPMMRLADVNGSIADPFFLW